MKDWVNNLFAATDLMDADGFVSFLSEDANFRFGNAPIVSGKENIRNTVSAFFSNLQGLRHNILGIWRQGDTVICEGEVTYTRRNESKITLPFADIFRMKGKLIADYRIFMDISPLFHLE